MRDFLFGFLASIGKSFGEIVGAILVLALLFGIYLYYTIQNMYYRFKNRKNDRIS